MVSYVLQAVGFTVLTIAAFMVSAGAGLVVLGAVLLFIGHSIDR